MARELPQAATLEAPEPNEEVTKDAEEAKAPEEVAEGSKERPEEADKADSEENEVAIQVIFEDEEPEPEPTGYVVLSTMHGPSNRRGDVLYDLPPSEVERLTKTGAIAVLGSQLAQEALVERAYSDGMVRIHEEHFLGRGPHQPMKPMEAWERKAE